VTGLAYGAVCIVGMLAPIEYAPGVIFDARSVVLSISGLFGGPIAAAIAGVIAGGYRIWIGGAGAPVGVAVVILCVLAGVAYREAVRRGRLKIGFWELLAFGTVVHVAVVGLFMFLPPPIASRVLDNIAIPMIVSFAPATALFGMLLNIVQERIQTRETVEQANLRFNQIANNIRDVFFVAKPDRSEYLYISPAYETIWGRSCEALYRNSREFFDSVIPDDRERVRSTIDNQAEKPLDIAYLISRPDGTVRSIRSQTFPVRDEKGAVIGVAGIAEDITELEERMDQLRQAQKMEALGQLTGGVAHDFNNLLQVIQGNAEVLSDRLPAGDPAIEAIRRAAARGADLTLHLLAYARRQPLKATVVDVPALVDRVSVLLERTLGSNIEFVSRISPDIWPVLADEAQLESALVNIAINARDAISGEGTLVVTGENISVTSDADSEWEVPPGDYVSISVSDNGAGMPPAVLEQVFEPFFTTKDVGRGSGLGLSMVYGFVNQSGGQVSIDSREGEGTTVSLLLPRAEAEASSPAVAQTGDTAHGQGQTVLVIEDEPEVRKLTVAMLESLGYRVRAVGSAEEARPIIESRAPDDKVHLMLSDIMLPGGMNGPDFVRASLEECPDMRFVFMSGYPRDFDRDPVGGWGDHVFLAKPFRKAELAEAVRDALA
jgi:PAS domain S-box-containing protein